MSSCPAIAADDLDERIAALRHRADGDVLTPGDAGFREAAQAWNRCAAHDPAVIVVAEDVGDVIAAVEFAATTDRGLGVQATGHGAALPVDGVLLVTSRMNRLEIDPEERTAWMQAGCRWGPVLTAAQEHGLAPLIGSSPTVGAVGYTLGGGLGLLARHYGPSCDAVRSLEVVTPDGELVFTSRDQHPELFHALCGGGGGSLGVVTEMEVQLFPVATVYGGDMSYAAADAAEVLTQWSRWVATVPDELTSSVVMLNVPGTAPVTLVRGCWSGDVDEGRRLLDEWRRTMPPTTDGWAAVPLTELAAISADPVEPAWRVVTGGWLDAESGSAIDAQVGAALAAGTFPADGAPALRYCEVRHAGGAIATSERRSASSMGNRDGEFLVHLVGVVDRAEDAAAMSARLARVRADLGEHLSARTYLNVLDGEARARAAATSIDPDDLAAISAVRAAVDPDDVMRFGVRHPV